MQLKPGVVLRGSTSMARSLPDRLLEHWSHRSKPSWTASRESGFCVAFVAGRWTATTGTRGQHAAPQEPPFRAPRCSHDGVHRDLWSQLRVRLWRTCRRRSRAGRRLESVDDFSLEIGSSLPSRRVARVAANNADSRRHSVASQVRASLSGASLLSGTYGRRFGGSELGCGALWPVGRASDERGTASDLYATTDGTGTATSACHWESSGISCCGRVACARVDGFREGLGLGIQSIAAVWTQTFSGDEHGSVSNNSRTSTGSVRRTCPTDLCWTNSLGRAQSRTSILLGWFLARSMWPHVSQNGCIPSETSARTL